MSREKRKLGRSGLETPPLVLGGNVFGWTVDEPASFEILDAFVAGGGTMIDSADVYSAWVPGNKGGESETIIGKWLKRRGRRDDILIATKVGFLGGLSAAAIEAAAEGSLKRLQTDHIDLYYAHRDDPEVPLEETLEALDRLVRAGKVRSIAASQMEAPRLGQARKISRDQGLAGYEVFQVGYSMIERGKFEGPLREVVLEEGMGVLVFYALANGYLTSKYRSEDDLRKSPRGQRVAEYLHGKGPRILAGLDAVAAEAGATPAQVALAWTAAQPGVTAPLASATSLSQLEELLGSMDLTLDEEQLSRLDAASLDD